MIEIVEFSDFVKRHPCEHLWINGRYLFRNGAESDGQERHSDPPEEIFPRLKLEREFLKFKLERATKRFHDIKAYVSDQAAMSSRYVNMPTPSVDAPRDLKLTQRLVFTLREKIKAIEEKMMPLDPEYQSRQQRRAADAERQALISSVVEACKDINI